MNPNGGNKPVTKKEACSILNISYNTIRLGKIITEFQERQKYVKKRKALNKGKKATNAEIRQIVFDYLHGENISTIAKELFRSVTFIKNIINNLGVPHRPANARERAKIALIPEQCIAESFEPKEEVWSAKYHAMAIINKEMPGYEKNYNSKCYSIYVTESIIQTQDSLFPGVLAGGFNAYALSYDLGKLNHLKIILDK